MGFFDVLLGRTKPVQPKLDDLFGLPSAAIQLEASTGFRPTGSGSVSFRAAEGKPFADIQKEVLELLDMDSGKPGGGLPVEVTKDSYGYTWLVSNHMSDEMDALVTDLHAVNSALVDGGFGPQLLCTLVSFTDDSHRRLSLVYLYKRGTFYPFAPLSGNNRDNALELQVKGILGDDLRIEPDLTRWFPVWGAPGLLSGLIAKSAILSGPIKAISPGGATPRTPRCEALRASRSPGAVRSGNCSTPSAPALNWQECCRRAYS